LPALEYLEDRTLLSAAYPAAHALTPGPVLAFAGAGRPAGLSPARVRHAYGFDQVTFANGAVRGDGSGQTIAIVDAYDQPNIAHDLAVFDATFGLAAPPSFTKVNQAGGTAYPAANAGWGLEISLDVEWAHAIAPGARILLVEANSPNWSDLLTAINYARTRPGVSVVSMSFGSGEWSSESALDAYFTTPAGHGGVTFVASSGDAGSAGAPNSPSVSRNVLAVGGTQLSADAAGNYLGETAWSGSGGGVSVYEAQPSYQRGVVTQTTTRRAVPDVSYDGSAGSPFAVYDTGYGGWIEVYGSSAGAPQWAALVAIAGQGRALAGRGALDGATQALPMLYQLPAADFHDVTSGGNGGYSAGPGYDLVTGRGTPRANLVVAGLAGTPASAPTPPHVTTPAHAAASPVTGTRTVLSVAGTDAAGSAGLSYTWSVTGLPSGAPAPTFSANGTNAAQNTAVTFYRAGTYTFLVTLRNAAGLTTTSSVRVSVNQTQTSLTLTPGSAALTAGHSRQFSVTARDQFGVALSRQPAWTWSLAAGRGALSATGLYTAPAAGSGSATVRVSGGGQSATASVTYAPPTPAAPGGLTAQAVSSGWILLTWADSSSNQTGFVIERSTDGGVWRQVGAVAANVRFFDDTTTSSAHTYAYRVRAYNGFGVSAFSNTTAAVRPASAARPAAPPAAYAASVHPALQGVGWQQVVNSLASFTLAPQETKAGHGDPAGDVFAPGGGDLW
jgi:subtilase family serine protease